ncbi:pyrimidine/purine nucleoside phosphorylase [Ectobacillus panaciterrae]|uniref:pyrimidine/purine nucleoside phosphorylase n=1 Tax=Ectobacillus panaciterrae TaxID=363872 RepID=UPI0004208279|nr:pyrimidine/purine nucleoside phosphorylase [Ectobacillus panaciterrae]
MEITFGELDVLLPGQVDWKKFSAGTEFVVPANASFKLKVYVVTDYCCSYMQIGASMPGMLVEPGDRIKKEEYLFVTEAMKMEATIQAPFNGMVK